MNKLWVMGAAVATFGCQFGAQVSYDVEHGYADSLVMASDSEGENLLTSDVDAKLFRIFSRNGAPVATLPWSSAGYDGAPESALGPFNGAATAYDALGFYVLGGDSEIHWIFPFLQGGYATYVIDEVPPATSGIGRAKACDISSGPDGSIYVLTGERTGLQDSWPLGAAWVHKRAPDGTWTQRSLAVNTQYISSGCGRIAFDVTHDRLVWLDMAGNFVRVLKPDLIEESRSALDDSHFVIDFEAIGSYTFLAYCHGVCGGETDLRIRDSSGEIVDSRVSANAHAVALERPPLPIGEDQETWLWTIGGGEAGPLTKHELITDAGD